MRIVALAALLAAALTLAGCSGGAKRLTKDEYARQADAVCREFQTKIEALGEPKSLADIVRLADRALPILEDGLGRLRRLRPHKDLEATAKAWLRTGDANVAALEDLRAAAEQRDEAAIQRVAREAETNDKLGDELATELGMKDCAEDST